MISIEIENSFSCKNGACHLILQKPFEIGCQQKPATGFIQQYCDHLTGLKIIAGPVLFEPAC
jgi:hypothetical protein